LFFSYRNIFIYTKVSELKKLLIQKMKSVNHHLLTDVFLKISDFNPLVTACKSAIC